MLTPSLFIDMHVPSHEREWSCICMLEVWLCLHFFIQILEISGQFYVFVLFCLFVLLFCLLVCLFVCLFVCLCFCLFAVDHQIQTHVTGNDK